MNFSKPKAAGNQPVIRKTTVRVPVTTATNPQVRATPPRPDPNRFKAALNRPGSTSQLTKKTPIPAQRAISASRGVKRKSATPQPVLFSDDEGDYSSDITGSDSDVSRKRIKSSVSSAESTGSRRTIISEKAFQTTARFEIIHGADATSGRYALKFKNPWQDEDFVTARLQYPSGQKEKFELKWPKNEKEDYKPMEDIIETIKTIVQFYLPDDLSREYLSEDNGFERRFSKAFTHENVDDFKEVVGEFNKEIQKLIDSGVIRNQLRSTSRLPLDWVMRILDQTYARTVSPKVETLRAYDNGTDDVYGELLPRFCSKIFKETKLNHEQVFVDLGSGVGNAVLQAALEIGCESWGMEKMPNPCELADLQAKEFPARTRLWGLSTGTTHLLRGDFTEDSRIAEVLKRADVVLVNNQAFTPTLNDRLRDMFFDLKDGCQVVSLKPFVPVGHKITSRNYSSVSSLFVQKKLEYFSNSVSWTDQGGDYFIATKDPRPLRRWMAANPSV